MSSNQVNDNMVKMREALLKARDVLKDAIYYNLAEECINDCIALLHSTLYETPRNFDEDCG